MNRTYLEEDLELIRKYFPGAQTTTLRTPFDLSKPSQRQNIAKADSGRTFFQDTANLLNDWSRKGTSWTF